MSSSLEQLTENLKQVIKTEIAQYLADNEIEADRVEAEDVVGLEDTVYQLVDSMELDVHSGNVRDLDSAIEDVVSGMDLEVEAKNIVNLDTTIDEYVKDYVEHYIENLLVESTAFKDAVYLEICNAVQSPVFHTTLKQIVLELIVDSVHNTLDTIAHVIWGIVSYPFKKIASLFKTKK